MKQKRSTNVRMGLMALVAALLTGCIFYEQKEDFKIVGARVDKVPETYGLGAWKGRLLVMTHYDGKKVIATVDTATDNVIAYHSLDPLADYPGFVVQENLLAYTISSGNNMGIGGVNTHNLLTGGGSGLNQPGARIMGANDRLFMSYPSGLIAKVGHENFAEILDGYKRVVFPGAPPNVFYVASQGDSIFLSTGHSLLYHSTNTGAVFDSVSLKNLLQDSISSVRQLAAHGGYLFIQMYRSGLPLFKDTAYMAVLNIPGLTVEKTIGLNYKSYNTTALAPRIANGKWYLCGASDHQSRRFDGIEVIDLKMRALEGQLVFKEQTFPEGMWDFVATGLHQGYAIDMRDQRVKKVTF